MADVNYTEIVMTGEPVVDRGQLGSEDMAALAKLCSLGIVERLATRPPMYVHKTLLKIEAIAPRK